MTITDKDRGLKKLRAQLKDLTAGKGAYVKAGVLGGPQDAPRSDGITNVELGMIHEFGAPGAGIPERSFVRSSFDAHEEDYIRILSKLLGAVYEGKGDVEGALGIVGAKMAADMKNGITDGAGIPPPLKPETIARKGSDRPLVDTGRMMDSITWDVVIGPGKAGE